MTQKQLIDDLNLVEVWREQNPDKNHYSCDSSTSKSNPELIISLFPGNAYPRLTNVGIMVLLSDHAAVSLKICHVSFVNDSFNMNSSFI